MAASTATRAVKPRVQKIRRIVTGHDAKGRSVILSDKPSPHVVALQGVPTFGVTDIWKTHSTPADNNNPKDPCSSNVALAPSANGSVVRVVEFPPDKVWMKKISRKHAFTSLGKSGSAAISSVADASRHMMMHRTQSIDYAIVLKGEIWALMDKGETKMRAGDILVQRGTSHAWANRSNKPCFIVFVLIDAKPVKGIKRGH